MPLHDIYYWQSITSWISIRATDAYSVEVLRSPLDKVLKPKQQPLISKQNHENKCYALIILYSVLKIQAWIISVCNIYIVNKHVVEVFPWKGF